MDDLCKRLEDLTQTLSECIISSQRDGSASSLANSGQYALPSIIPITNTSNTDTVPSIQAYMARENNSSSETQDDLPSQSHNSGLSPSYQTPAGPVGHMVADSYGRLRWVDLHRVFILKVDTNSCRYVGGAGNNIVIEAVQSLSPETNPPTGKQPSIKKSEVELPFFVHGQTWPEMPYLPQAKDILRPPRYISDLLVGIYFEQLHYTFPILYMPRFMKQYNEMQSMKSDSLIDKGFLSVFFAVCACASCLLPQTPGTSQLVGIEYYQKAQLLFFASSGEVFIEQVQCLGLLSLCSASWNVLAQSWRFAGQAVRIAQDLGLHLSSLVLLSPFQPRRRYVS